VQMCIERQSVIGRWRNRHLQLKETYMKVVKPNQTFAAAAAVW
jgi:hypothetical protein